MIYDIDRELSRKRACIKGEFKDLPIDAEVVVRDDKGVLYDAVVTTRYGDGVVVYVRGVLVD